MTTAASLQQHHYSSITTAASLQQHHCSSQKWWQTLQFSEIGSESSNKVAKIPAKMSKK